MSLAELPAASLFDVEGRRVLVLGTGPAALAVASVLRRSGATLALVDDDPRRLAEAAASLGADSVEALSYPRGDWAALRELIAEFGARLRGLDAAFLASSVGRGPGYLEVEGRLEQLDRLAWDGAVDATLHASFAALQALAAVMEPAGDGRIVVVTTRAARRSDDAHGYGDIAAGSGLVNLARQAAFELAPKGVRVNTVVAGPLPGEDATAATKLDELAAGVPLGRVGAPGDLEGVALFLASDASAFVTGAILAVDGGSMTRQNPVPPPRPG